MDLSLAASYFNTVSVDGWDNTANGTWVRNVSRGTLQVYDRFVSDRTFGEKKRVFAIGARSGEGRLPPQFSVIRLPDGKPYMVEYLNADSAHDGVYSAVYMLHEATVRAQVYELTSAPLPSGLPGSVSRLLKGTYWADMDKFSSGPSDIESVRRETEAMWLERGAEVLPSYHIVVGTEEFLPREVSHHADLTFLRVEKLTA